MSLPNNLQLFWKFARHEIKDEGKLATDAGTSRFAELFTIAGQLLVVNYRRSKLVQTVFDPSASIAKNLVVLRIDSGGQLLGCLDELGGLFEIKGLYGVFRGAVTLPNINCLKPGLDG